MTYGLSRQILLPATALLLLAVGLNAAFAAWWTQSVEIAGQQRRQDQIAAVLAESTFPLTDQVLRKLQVLTGDEFLVWNRGKQQIEAASRSGWKPSNTISAAQSLAPLLTLSNGEPDSSTVMIWNGERFLARREKWSRGDGQELYILTSSERVAAAGRRAAWAPVVVGATSLVLLVPLLAWVSHRLGKRLEAIELQVNRIAQGEFGREIPGAPTDDEVSRLVRSVNLMSTQLRSYRDTLARTERARLIGQLAAGFTHQVRNAITGVRLAVQLHLRRCTPHANDASLRLALEQLEMVEAEVNGLLALGRESSSSPEPIDLVTVCQDAARQMGPQCTHRGVQLKTSLDTGPVVVNLHKDAGRGAILNLLHNALSAVDRDGVVKLALRVENGDAVVCVSDNGPGPPASIADELFEPFVTSKPEGAGLGLTVAQRVARQHGGNVCWRRNAGWTEFEWRVHHGAVGQA